MGPCEGCRGRGRRVDEKPALRIEVVQKNPPPRLLDVLASAAGYTLGVFVGLYVLNKTLDDSAAGAST